MIGVLQQALAITLFVSVMMLVIDYANVLWQGAWMRRLAAGRWSRYILAGLLGALPGCLGAFTAVAMYSHRALTIGGVVTTMIATSGDEAFVLLALVPRTALLLTVMLFVIGVAAGFLTDAFMGGLSRTRSCAEGEFQLHGPHAKARIPTWSKVRGQWKACVAARGLVAGGLSVFTLLAALGAIGPQTWDWLRCTLVGVGLLGLLIVAVAPDHFIEEHLWRHIVCQHSPRLFLWTFGALAVMVFFSGHVGRTVSSQTGAWAMLAAACVVGLIPESGPHLVFVTLYAQGALPFSVLLANSIVQDGHGMLPMLAHSRRAFLGVKAVNFLAGFLAGAVALMAGW